MLSTKISTCCVESSNVTTTMTSLGPTMLLSSCERCGNHLTRPIGLDGCGRTAETIAAGGDRCGAGAWRALARVPRHADGRFRCHSLALSRPRATRDAYKCHGKSKSPHLWEVKR
jgi:hypothetical protein